MNPDQPPPSPDPGSLWPNQSEEVQSSTDTFVSSAEIVFSTGPAGSSQPFSVVSSGSGFQPGHVVYTHHPSFQLNTGQAEVIYQHPHSTFGRLSPPVEEYQPGSPAPLQGAPLHGAPLPPTPSSPLQHYQHVVHQQRLTPQNLSFPVVFERRQVSSPLIGQDHRPLSQSPPPVQLIGGEGEVLNQSALAGGSEAQSNLVHSSRVFSPTHNIQNLSNIQGIPVSTLSKLGYTVNPVDGTIRLDVKLPDSGQGIPVPEPSTSQQARKDVLRIAKTIEEDVAERFSNEPDTTQNDHVAFITDDRPDFSSDADDLRTSALHGIHILAHSSLIDSRLPQSHVPDDSALDHVTGVTSQQQQQHGAAGAGQLVSEGVENRLLLDRDSLMVSDLVNFSSGHLQRSETDRFSLQRSVQDNFSLGQLQRSDEISESERRAENDSQSGVRKSTRLLNQSQSEKRVLTAKEYEPVPYKPEHLWCDECMRSYVHACPDHRLNNIIDKVVLSRAWASLPGALQIFRLGDSNELGVFAKKQVPKRTQFGPFVAALVEDKETLPTQKFLLKIEQYKPPHKVSYLDATDESKCNWMMFVRPAQNYREQNLVAYQYQTDIYFTVTRPIEPRDELKVWYAAHYAHQMNVPVHYPTEEDIDAIAERENKWPCFECSRRFRTSALLQAHLSDHEREDNLRRQEELYREEMTQRENVMKQQALLQERLNAELEVSSTRTPPTNEMNLLRTPTNDISLLRTPSNSEAMSLLERAATNPSTTADSFLDSVTPNGNPSLQQEPGNSDLTLPSNSHALPGNSAFSPSREDVEDEDDDMRDADFVMREEEDSEEEQGRSQLIKPLKKRDDIVSNWRKKKSTMYLNRYRRQKQTLFKKRETEGENEWVCTHCDLTFDNSNLLNLHTLTHAAEDVGLSEIFCEGLQSITGGTEPIQTDIPMDEDPRDVVERYSCPVCRQSFQNKKDLIDHASCHAKVRQKTGGQQSVDLKKKYRCQRCWKGFTSEENLQRHMLVHGSDDAKPISCKVCKRRFLNNSALSCHVKIHEDNKFFQCLICNTGFAQLVDLKNHCFIHLTNGKFQCPKCDNSYKEYTQIHRHLRMTHPLKMHECPHCDKKFTRPDKLKLHMLKHSAHREFMCETCGRQFKRKDKLKEHMDRIHTEEREAQEVEKRASQLTHPPTPKFVPKVAPSDFTRFIYKCHLCLLGFKRRGMLVNHLANRHPDVQIESVPELNLPILKTQRDYYCTFCEKVYKSSSKRKVHMLKNHPGAELPVSGRKHQNVYEEQMQVGQINATYSQPVGSVTTVPHQCPYCHKQYASKAKLLQHERKKHSDEETSKSKVTDAKLRTKTIRQQQQQQHVVVEQQHEPNDLLTQAMSELTQTLVVGDYRVTTNQFRPAEIQLTVNQPAETPAPTIDATQLQQLLQAAQFQPAQGQSFQLQVPLSVPDSSGNLSQQQVVIPVTSGTLSNLQSGAVSYVSSSRGWAAAGSFE